MLSNSYEFTSEIRSSKLIIQQLNNGILNQKKSLQNFEEASSDFYSSKCKIQQLEKEFEVLNFDLDKAMNLIDLNKKLLKKKIKKILIINNILYLPLFLLIFVLLIH